MLNFCKRITKNTIYYWILKFKNYKPEESILVFSEPRGGSTWLVELLNNIPNTCINWEPLHTDKGVIPKTYKFSSRPYIPVDDNTPENSKFVRDIHTFSISTEWTRKYLSLWSLLKSRFVITKYIRANHLLPYIMRNFEFKYPPIVLLRHPIDTCLSQIRAFPHENMTLISKVDRWCLNNASIINQLDGYDNILIVYYSDLIINPENEVIRILNRYGIGNHRDIIKHMKFRNPSKTVIGENLIVDPEEQLYKNFKLLEGEMKNKIQQVFDRYDFKLYDAYSPVPKTS